MEPGAREGMATHLCSGCGTAESTSSFGLSQLQMAICVLIRTEAISAHGEGGVLGSLGEGNLSFPLTMTEKNPWRKKYGWTVEGLPLLAIRKHSRY